MNGSINFLLLKPFKKQHQLTHHWLERGRRRRIVQSNRACAKNALLQGYGPTLLCRGARRGTFRRQEQTTTTFHRSRSGHQQSFERAAVARRVLSARHVSARASSRSFSFCHLTRVTIRERDSTDENRQFNDQSTFPSRPNVHSAGKDLLTKRQDNPVPARLITTQSFHSSFSVAIPTERIVETTNKSRFVNTIVGTLGD